ncbi:nucleotidyltransferase [Bacillus coahuilensis]|uniref:nucleotidyltransferase n=1 Tax=Bacillus coahuilensis TaxID=408580 RepID=UPI0001850C06|nr:nucleotidyltransferase [Bacillus coahuilensis]
MSGNFLQRGEPAILDKWARTRMALRGGADLVIELPYAFATQHAEVFARGAVTILHSLKCKSISFGSESGDISAFHKTKSFLQTYDEEYNQLISSFIKEGISYPKAQNLALRSLATTSRILDLSQPNNILGYHYVSSIKDIGSQIQPYTVERKGAGYHDEDSISFEFASATGIRKLLNENNGRLDSITSLVPLSTVEEIDKYPYTLRSWEDYWPFLQYKLISTSAQELSYMYEVEEGIENRLSKFANQATCFQEFMNLVKTKRYTWTRIQRMLLHILTHTSKEKMNQNMHITSLRLLGMNSVGREYLHSVKKGARGSTYYKL